MGVLPRFGTSQRAQGLDEPRGRLFGQLSMGFEPEPAAASGPALSVTRAMEILELIAERRTQHFGTSLGFVDRIQLLP